MKRRTRKATRAASWKNRAFDRRKSKNFPCTFYTDIVEADLGEYGYIESPSWEPITLEEADRFDFSCACAMRDI